MLIARSRAVETMSWLFFFAALLHPIQGRPIEVGRLRLLKIMDAIKEAVRVDCKNEASMKALTTVMNNGLGGPIQPTVDLIYFFVSSGSSSNSGRGRSGGCCSPSPLFRGCRTFCTHGTKCRSLGGTCTLIEIARSIDPLTSCFSKDFVGPVSAEGLQYARSCH